MERYAEDWRPRFAEAYRLQNKAFVQFVRTGTFPPIAADAWDGFCAATVSEAGITALRTTQRTPIPHHDRPSLYAPN